MAFNLALLLTGQALVGLLRPVSLSVPCLGPRLADREKKPRLLVKVERRELGYGRVALFWKLEGAQLF